MAKPNRLVALLNPCPATAGHVCALDARGNRLDSFSGPRELVIAAYAASGYDVRDESGRRC